MIANLHGLQIALDSQDEQVRRQWHSLFDFELLQETENKSAQEADILVEVKVVQSAPPLPNVEPVYFANDPSLKVYAHIPGEIILLPSSQANISLKLRVPENGRKSREADAVITITPFVLESDRFEDVVTLALAPFLRRRGLFMVHAFTASWQNQALMFVGPSGSGKTSCGLALVTGGWHLLANDIALLREDGMVEALLSPGTVHATAKTIALLPALAESMTLYAPHPYHGKIPIPRLDLLQDKGQTLSAGLKIIYFPEIGPEFGHETAEIHRAVGLARMMEASMDQWDKFTWQDHIDFLERLSHQVAFRKLILGKDLPSLPQFLSRDL